MEDRDDFDDLALQPVDEAIRTNDDLAEVGATELGNHATRLRELKEATGGREEPANDEAGVLLGVGGDVLADRFEVGDRPRRPDEATHAPKRRFTSS